MNLHLKRKHNIMEKRENVDYLRGFCCSWDHRGGLLVRASASWAGGRGFDPRPRQTKVFKTDSGGFPP